MIKEIQEFYLKISHSYDLVNSLLTLGLDARWRRKAVKMAARSCSHPGRCLDICSGTGQTAFLLARDLSPESQITAADLSAPMLERARERIAKKNVKNIRFTFADAVKLPFKDKTFDIITISFATRNLGAAPGHLLQAFREFHRVLKPGGCFLNLETSQPPLEIIRKLFHLYVRLTVAPLGRIFSGSGSSYRYLSESIRTFYSARELSEILHEAGFETAEWRNLLFGGVAIHKARSAPAARPLAGGT